MQSVPLSSSRQARLDTFTCSAMKTVLYAAGKELMLEYTQPGESDELHELVWNGQPQQPVHVVAIRDGTITVLVDGRPLHAHIVRDGDRSLISIEGQTYEFNHTPPKHDRTRLRGTSGSFEPEIRSPMPGKILSVKVVAGQVVAAGQTLVLLEAMKMENTLTAEGEARVAAIHVADGDLVELGQVLVKLEPLASLG